MYRSIPPANNEVFSFLVQFFPIHYPTITSLPFFLWYTNERSTTILACMKEKKKTFKSISLATSKFFDRILTQYTGIWYLHCWKYLPNKYYWSILVWTREWKQGGNLALLSVAWHYSTEDTNILLLCRLLDNATTLSPLLTSFSSLVVRGCGEMEECRLLPACCFLTKFPMLAFFLSFSHPRFLSFSKLPIQNGL